MAQGPMYKKTATTIADDPGCGKFKTTGTKDSSTPIRKRGSGMKNE